MRKHTAPTTHLPLAGTSVAMTLFMTFAAFLLMSDAAWADSGSTMGIILCNVVSFFVGNAGRALATLAVISLGVGATLGKVSWGLAITVAVGIAVIFNAPAIVTQVLQNSQTGLASWGCAV